MQLRKLASGVCLSVVLLTLLLLGGVEAQTLINGNQIQSHTITALQLNTTGVTAATYGDSSHVPQIAVAADGRITSASNVSTGAAAGISVSLFNSTNQTLTHNTEAALAFDSEDYDLNGLHSTTTNTSRITIPTGADGVYKFTGRTKFTSAFSGAVHLRLYKNGSLVTENTATGADLSSTNEFHQVSADISLVATDFVELKILVELSAGSGTINTVSGTGNTQFQATSVVSGVVSGSGGSFTLVEQHTASTSATLDFTSCISSTYDDYQIEVLNLIPATTNVDLFVRVSTDGGVTYDSSSIYASSIFAWSNSGSTAAGELVTAPVGQWKLRSNAEISNDSNYGVNGFAKLYAPGSAIYKKLEMHLSYLNNASAMAGSDSRGIYKSATAVNAFRFLFSSGNITSGTIRCYGIAKS